MSYNNINHLYLYTAGQAGVRYSLENPRTYINANIIGTFNILEGCKNFEIQHLLFSSTSSVYGDSNLIPFKEIDKTDEPLSFYAASKNHVKLCCILILIYTKFLLQ